MDPVVADLNLYLYVGNAVTQMIDPSGAMPEWVRRICPGNAPITPSDRPDISGACNLVDCLKKVNKWVSKYERICQRRFRGLPIGGYKGKILHGKCAQQCMGYDDMKSRSGDTKWWGIRDSAGNWVWIYSGGVTEIERQYNHKCKTKFP